MTVRRYTPGDQHVWNDFVAKAKNATFLFNREYMDYHSHRFVDHSLLVLDGDRLMALFVANEDKDVICSHGGLTYGGLVLKKDVTTEEALSYFYHVLKYYSNSFGSVVYKCFPSEYTQSESAEDLYAMYILKAELIRRQTSSVLERQAALPYRKSKRENVVRPAKLGQQYTIVKTNDPLEFWSKVLTPNLRDRFNAAPAHSAEEMQLLMKRFPSNINLYEIRDNDILGGAVVYIMNDIVHTQYLSATEEGKKADILDVLVDHLITHVFTDKSKVSLGTSNEDEGKKINRGLISWKEGFGARTRVHDIYRIDTSRYIELKDYE